MKCPNCRFISSNKRDVCPECLIDLRPHKKALGIPVSKPNASIHELREELENSGAARDALPAKSTAGEAPAEKCPPKKNSWLSRLLGKQSPQAQAPESESPLTVESKPEPLAAPAPDRAPGTRDLAPPEEPALMKGAEEAKPSEATVEPKVERFAEPRADTNSEATGEAAREAIAISFDYLEETVCEQAPEPEDGPISLEETEPNAEGEEEGVGGELWKEFLAEMAQAVEEFEASTPALSAESRLAPENADSLTSPAAEPSVFEQIEVSPQPEGVEETAQENLPPADAGADDEPLFPAPIDPIESFAKAIEAGLIEATAAADEIAEAAAEAPSEESEDLGLLQPKAAANSAVDSVSPVVSPEVLEFNDADDALLEQQLDEMIGDLILDVEAVKQEKKFAPPVPTGIIIEDDLEISFEFEIEGSDDEEGQLELQTPAQTKDQDVLDDLLSAFNELDSAVAEVSASAQAGEEVRQAAAVKEQQVRESISEASVRSTRLKQLSQMLGVGPDDLLKELTDIVIEAHGIDPALLQKRDLLSELEKELEQQIHSLEAEGTTFYNSAQVGGDDPAPNTEEPPSTDAQAARAPEQEPAALEVRHMLYSEPSVAEAARSAAPNTADPAHKESGTPRESDAPEVIFNGSTKQIEETELSEALKALNEFADALSEESEFIEISGAAEPDAVDDEKTPCGAPMPLPEPRAPVTSLPADDPRLWDAVAEELEFRKTDDVEIGSAELFEFKPDDRFTVLFDMVEEELAEPAKLRRAAPEAIPSSEKRKVDSTDLAAAFNKFEKEERKIAEIKQAAAVERTNGQPQAAEISVDLPFAGLGRRAAGALIDLIVSGGAALIVTVVMFCPAVLRLKLLTFSPVHIEDVLPYFFVWIGLWAGAWIVGAIFMTLSSGQTIGQRLCGIQVLDELGGMVGVENAVVRALAQFATLLSLGIGVAPGAGKTGRTLQDRLARTIVTMTAA